MYLAFHVRGLKTTLIKLTWMRSSTCIMRIYSESVREMFGRVVEMNQNLLEFKLKFLFCEVKKKAFWETAADVSERGRIEVKDGCVRYLAKNSCFARFPWN